MARPFALPVLAAVLVAVVGACAAGAFGPTPSTPSDRPGTAPGSQAAPPAGSVSPAAPAPATEPPPTSPPPATAGASPTAQESPMPTEFTLSSTAFRAGGQIPARFTCDGVDVSPDLAWAGTPDGTAALVLVVDDPDANGFVHWLVYDIGATESGGLPLGVSSSPDAPPQGTNGFGKVGWGGPCPPSGEHRYRFTLYALAAPLALDGAPKIGAIRSALDAAEVLGTARLEGRYRRR